MARQEGPTMVPLDEPYRALLKQRLDSKQLSQKALGRELGVSAFLLVRAAEGQPLQMAKKRRLERALGGA